MSPPKEESLLSIQQPLRKKVNHNSSHGNISSYLISPCIIIYITSSASLRSAPCSLLLLILWKKEQILCAQPLVSSMLIYKCNNYSSKSHTLIRKSAMVRCSWTCCLIGASPASISTTQMRGGRDERDDACFLGFDSCKDNLGGCYAEAGWTGALTGPFGYIDVGLSEGRLCEKRGRGWGMEREQEREGMYARLLYASTAIPCQA